MNAGTRQFRQLVRQFRPQIHNDLASLIRTLATRRGTRRVLNAVYSSLTAANRVRFYGRFSKVFRERQGAFQDGSWNLRFDGKQLIVPLRSGYTWLDWDAALSIIGHDSELKHTYRSLARLEHPPRVVFDIGANYGTHSLLLLALGMRTISFEPNPACHNYFRLVCESNHLNYQLEPTAVGASPGLTELSYPEREEWLGTTQSTASEQMTGNIRKIGVPVTTVDHYARDHEAPIDLIKIDVEGMELDVLRGATQTLKQWKPILLFESWKSEPRTELADFLHDSGYEICVLPLGELTRPPSLPRQEFLQSDQTNFGAVPIGKLETWPPEFRMTQ
jgi:FkbM family methyltransferase